MSPGTSTAGHRGATADLPRVIVHDSLWLPEDVLLSSANVKVNELLGRIVALVDIVASHLLMVQAQYTP